jgi:hypothetical protein
MRQRLHFFVSSASFSEELSGSSFRERPEKNDLMSSNMISPFFRLLTL